MDRSRDGQGKNIMHKLRGYKKRNVSVDIGKEENGEETGGRSFGEDSARFLRHHFVALRLQFGLSDRSL